jgi:hypothetical protein
MKVKCINARYIPNNRGGFSRGDGLEEGKIYLVEKEVDSNYGNGKCYLIKGLGKRRAERFEKQKDEWTENLLKNLISEVCLN